MIPDPKQDHHSSEPVSGELPGSDLRTKKLARLEEVRREIDAIWGTDGPIDEKIKPLVIACNVLGFRTTSSCEGHIPSEERPCGARSPMVEISAPFSGPRSVVWYNMPFRYVGEQEAAYAAARENGIDPLEWNDHRWVNWPMEKREQYKELGMKAMRACEKNGLTEEFRDWSDANYRLMERLTLLTAEFNQGRTSGARVYLSGNWGLPFDISTLPGRTRLERTPNTLTPAELQATVKAAQGTMDEFAEFLREHYLSQDSLPG